MLFPEQAGDSGFDVTWIMHKIRVSDGGSARLMPVVVK
jgi:hypothetical protein